MNVRSDHEHFRPFMTFYDQKSLETVMKRLETVMKRLETVMKRLETVRDVERLEFNNERNTVLF